MRMGRARERLGCGLALLSLGGLAMPTAAADPGDHVRTGNAEIIPYVDVLGAYRTNVYLLEGTVGGGQPTRSGAYLAVTPGLGMEIGGDDASFDFDVAYNLRKYLSSEQSNLDRYKDLSLAAELDLLPSSTLGVRLMDDLEISSRETEAVNASDAYVQHLENVAGGRVFVRPGSSMELALGGDFEYDDYDVPPSLNLQNISNLNSRSAYGPNVGYRWKFLPKTAVLADFEMRWFNWDDNFIDTRDASNPENVSAVGSGLGIADGSSWRVSAGLRGRFTSKLILGAVAGYGQITYDENSVIDDAANELVGDESEADASQGFGVDLKGFPLGLILALDARYELTEHQKFTFGYIKDFQDSYFTNFVSYGYAYVRYDGVFADLVGVTTEAGLRAEDYQGEITRKDNLVRARYDMSYFATPWLDVNGGVWWVRRVSASGAAGIEYDDVNVHLGATLTY